MEPNAAHGNAQPAHRALFEGIDRHLLSDAAPSAFLDGLRGRPEWTAFPFSLLAALARTKQSPQYHAEGDAWKHTLLVVDEAARVRERSQNPRALMWAALLHDIGKPATTKVRKGRITSYDHDRAGEKLALDFLRALTDDEAFTQAVAALVRYHMHPLYVLKNLPFADTAGMERRCDVREVALLGLCDRLGRAGADRSTEEREISLFLRKVL